MVFVDLESHADKVKSGTVIMAVSNHLVSTQRNSTLAKKKKKTLSTRISRPVYTAIKIRTWDTECMCTRIDEIHVYKGKDTQIAAYQRMYR